MPSVGGTHADICILQAVTSTCVISACRCLLRSNSADCQSRQTQPISIPKPYGPQAKTQYGIGPPVYPPQDPLGTRCSLERRQIIQSPGDSVRADTCPPSSIRLVLKSRHARCSPALYQRSP